MEVLKKFMSTVTYLQVDKIINAFVTLTDEAKCNKNGFFIRNVNPYMIIIHMLDISNLIKTRFIIAESNEFENRLVKFMVDFLNSSTNVVLVSKLLNKKDLTGRTAFDHIARLNLYSIL